MEENKEKKYCEQSDCEKCKDKKACCHSCCHHGGHNLILQIILYVIVFGIIISLVCSLFGFDHGFRRRGEYRPMMNSNYDSKNDLSNGSGSVTVNVLPPKTQASGTTTPSVTQ